MLTSRTNHGSSLSSDNAEVAISNEYRKSFLRLSFAASSSRRALTKDGAVSSEERATSFTVASEVIPAAIESRTSAMGRRSATELSGIVNANDVSLEDAVDGNLKVIDTSLSV